MNALRTLIVTLILSAFAISAYAQRLPYYQDPRWGNDSIERAANYTNYALYKDWYKQKNFEKAYEKWSVAYNTTPEGSENILIDGKKMLIYSIKKERDAAAKEILVDSLERVTLNHIKYYPKKEAYITGALGVNLAKYSSTSNVSKMKKAYDYIYKTYQMDKRQFKTIHLFMYMRITDVLYSNEEIDAEQYLKNYEEMSSFGAAYLKAKPQDEGMIAALESCDELFFNSTVATCENVLPVFQKYFDAAPENEENLTEILDILDNIGCDDSELYFAAAENLYRVNPTAKAAYKLAKMSQKTADYDKAKAFLLEAVSVEEDNVLKSKYLIDIASMLYNDQGLGQEACKYAYKAADADPTAGKPYMLIGSIYAAAGCGDADFDGRALYWLATDMYAKAKSIDPSLSESANVYLSNFRSNYPIKKDVFMKGLKEGASYRIECWIQKTTKVRYKPE